RFSFLHSFCFHAPPTPPIYTLSLHDALPISFGAALASPGVTGDLVLANDGVMNTSNGCEPFVNGAAMAGKIALVDRGTCPFVLRSEEHTSELQSRGHLVCRLLLEKKNIIETK